MQLGLALAEARLQGRRQWEVAVAADVDPATLSRILHRERHPTAEQAAAIAGVLGREVADLFPDLNDGGPARQPGLATTPASPGGGRASG